jgi:4-hydroxy-tetrahydrodipicolinate reductase
VIRVVVAGATGRTGSAVARAVTADRDLDLVGRVAPSLAGTGEGTYGLLSEALAAATPEVVVDFTRPDLIDAHATLCVEAGVPLVLGTSGLDAGLRDEIDADARERGVPVFWAPNFALGAVVALRLAELAARLLPSAEIVELHSAHKLDAPSGTSLATAERLAGATGRAVPIHSVRLPGPVAHQEVLLGAEGQLLTIRHDAYDRCAYAPGVLLAIRAVRQLPPGLTVGLERLLGDALP